MSETPIIKGNIENIDLNNLLFGELGVNIELNKILYEKINSDTKYFNECVIRLFIDVFCITTSITERILLIYDFFVNKNKIYSNCSIMVENNKFDPPNALDLASENTGFRDQEKLCITYHFNNIANCKTHIEHIKSMLEGSCSESKDYYGRTNFPLLEEKMIRLGYDKTTKTYKIQKIFNDFINIIPKCINKS